MEREYNDPKIPDQELEYPPEPPERLKKPSRKLAQKLLSEVSFEDRFVGYRMRQRAGSVAVTCYSFEQVVHLLRDQLPMIDLTGLERWVRQVLCDECLADKIGIARDQGQNNYQRTLLIRELAEERLRQCKAITTLMKQQA